MRKCSLCKIEKEEKLFSKSKGNWCLKCRSLYQMKWRKAHPFIRNNYARKGMLRRNYNLTVEEFTKISNSQNNLCAICKKEQNRNKSMFLHVDHNHETGKIRGLLCDLCNRGLGYFMDSPKLLVEASNYLIMHEENK